MIDAFGEDVPSSKDMLAAVTSALRGNRSKLDALMKGAKKDLRTRAVDELDRVVRALVPPPKRSKTAKRKGSIRGAKPKRLAPLPTLSPRSFELRMPGGRRARVRTRPGVVALDELVALRERLGRDHQETREAVRSNGAAVDALAARLAELEAKVDAMSPIDLALLQRVFQQIGGVEATLESLRGKLTKTASEVRTTKKRLGASQAQVRAQLQQATRSAVVEKINRATGSMQTAAFGASGDLLSTDNMLLALSQTLASFSGPLGAQLGLPASTATWAGPLVGLLASQLALSRRQHERFISGVAESFSAVPRASPGVLLAVSAPSSGELTARVSLRRYIAPALWTSFSRRTDVVASAEVLGDALDLATVRSVGVVGGELRISLFVMSKDVGETLRVGWTIDTREVSSGR